VLGEEVREALNVRSAYRCVSREVFALEERVEQQRLEVGWRVYSVLCTTHLKGEMMRGVPGLTHDSFSLLRLRIERPPRICPR
jgi:hypothetical protein